MASIDANTLSNAIQAMARHAGQEYDTRVAMLEDLAKSLGVNVGDLRKATGGSPATATGIAGKPRRRITPIHIGPVRLKVIDLTQDSEDEVESESVDDGTVFAGALEDGSKQVDTVSEVVIETDDVVSKVRLQMGKLEVPHDQQVENFPDSLQDSLLRGLGISFMTDEEIIRLIKMQNPNAEDITLPLRLKDADGTGTTPTTELKEVAPGVIFTNETEETKDKTSEPISAVERFTEAIGINKPLPLLPKVTDEPKVKTEEAVEEVNHIMETALNVADEVNDDIKEAPKAVKQVPDKIFH